ncbi:MerR family transcriptional regulator [Cohnella caldifontis]|uniref:MerR family transcriptional regulator n=1 Tax=Cohnella caldifontis TaxID=3027471 RepID=UPI0023EDB00A|nr:MerR family transcriptional regulator [Cohnella sp. YIM B05605]
MKRKWKVGELARMAGLTVRTLRYYDQIGLYSPSGHTESGHRIYVESDLARLQQIQSLKELGLTLEEIKAALGGERFSMLEIVSLQIERLKQNISVQQKLLQELESVANRIQRDEPLTVENFANVLASMRKTHEKFFAERRSSWDRHLDRLGDFLESRPETPYSGG